MVSVTIGQLKIIDTHTNRYLGDCAPDVTVIPIGYGVGDYNAVLVMELQVGTSAVITRVPGVEHREPSTTHGEQVDSCPVNSPFVINMWVSCTWWAVWLVQLISLRPRIGVPLA